LIDSGILMRQWPLITFIKTPLTTLNYHRSVDSCASLLSRLPSWFASAYLPYLWCFHLTRDRQSERLGRVLNDINLGWKTTW
jgi:hypothetical protein